MLHSGIDLHKNDLVISTVDAAGSRSNENACGPNGRWSPATLPRYSNRLASLWHRAKKRSSVCECTASEATISGC